MTGHSSHSSTDRQNTFATAIEQNLERWLPRSNPLFERTLRFAVGRFEEGRGHADFFIRRGLSGKVLDVGAGNGGASFAVATWSEFDVTASDIVANNDLRELRQTMKLPVRQVVADGHHLPFADDSFAIVLCLDTLEHVPQAKLLGPEIMRVLEPGGVCLITTPARFRYWFQRDPHYGIPGLLILPDALQEWLGRKIVGRYYDVTHTYCHVAEISRLFPQPHEVEVLWHRTYTGQGWGDRIWYRFKNFFWDRVLIWKRAA